MPAPTLERTRRLIDAALANGIISDDERRAVDRALRPGVDVFRLETAIATLVGQLESVRRDTQARRCAFDRFFDRVEGRPAEAAPAPTGGRMSTLRAGGSPRIDWAGNLGRVMGPDAEYSRGVPEPAYFVRSLSTRDAMVLTAEAYVPGITDSPYADLTPVLAEVLSDLGETDGAVRPVRLDGIADGRRVNNNLRVHWNVAPLVARSPVGRFHYQFRFSTDGGASFLTVPADVRHLVVAEDLRDVPAEALVESSLLFKVGEVTPARIGWIGAATVRTARDEPARPLPVEGHVDVRSALSDGFFLELAVQVWAPGVSNRADLTPDEHALALRQLGVRVESPFFIGRNTQTPGFAGKAGIHEHDDIARFNLAGYFAALDADKVQLPPSGDYPFEVWAGDKKLGVFLLHWARD
jgi:hypothetical protein